MFTILGADGKEYGPVPAEKINEWIRGGRANAQTRARRQGETDWKTLGEFAEFAPPVPAAPATEAVPPPPPVPMPDTVPSVPAYAPGSSLTGPVPVAPLADRGARLVAQLIDILAGFVVVLPGLVLLAVGGAFHDDFSPLSVVGLILAGIGALALFIYQVYSLSTRGQTLGKRLMDVKIANYDDGANPGFVKAVLLRLVVNGLIGAVPLIGFLYTIADICFIFRDDRRCLHDFIAGTHVVKAK